MKCDLLSCIYCISYKEWVFAGIVIKNKVKRQKSMVFDRNCFEEADNSKLLLNFFVYCFVPMAITNSLALNSRR